MGKRKKSGRGNRVSTGSNPAVPRTDRASPPPTPVASPPVGHIACPQCQASNTFDARYCEQCGGELGNPEAATLVFDPQQLAEARARSGESDARQSGEGSGPQGASLGQVPVLTHTLNGQTADGLLQLVRRELADHYDVECEVGRGGMAIVYRAIERQLRRTVALKVLPPELLLGPAVVGRFEREAQMAAALDHPSIIPIYRVGKTSALAYLAMKYVEGRGLDRVIAEQGALPIPVVLLVLRAATSAVAYAHEHGIVHRDIKGGNILIDRDGRVIVTDFGVARAIDNASMTTTGSVIGTPYFMSPEQCAGKIAAPQSDQYSLGVVAFHMLTGALPFQADTLAAIMHHHFFTPPPDVTKVREDIPDELGAILDRVLAKDPERRYATTADMLAAVDAVPLADADRAQGEAMLRNLARGTALPSVRTAAMPPLADTMAVVAAHDAYVRSSGRRRQVRRRISGASAVVVASVLGLWLWRRPIPINGAPPVDSARGGSTGSPTPPVNQAIVSVTAPTIPPVVVPTSGRVGRQPAHHAVAIDSGLAVHHTSTGPSVALAPVVQPPDTATGKLRVRALPGDALIVIDNETIGQGAVVDRDILVGERHLRITAPGYADFDTTIVIKVGETTRLSAVELKATEP